MRVVRNRLSTPSPGERRARHGALQRLARWAVLHGSRRRAIGVLASASIGDFFVPALPTQSSVIALGWLQPRRAAWIALAFATAAGLGACVLATLLSIVDDYARQFGVAQFGAAWTEAAGRVREFGVWAVLLASVFPTPPRLLVAATLLAGASAVAVGAAVFAGKLLWFALFLAVLIRAPGWLAKVPVLGRTLARVEALRQEVAPPGATDTAAQTPVRGVQP